MIDRQAEWNEKMRRANAAMEWWRETMRPQITDLKPLCEEPLLARLLGKATRDLEWKGKES